MRLVTGWLRSRRKCIGGRTWSAKRSFSATPKAFGVVVDTKVIDRITDHKRGLMLNYLRITNLRVGVILNFKHAKLEWERIIL
jgi:hypothetical protein